MNMPEICEDLLRHLSSEVGQLESQLEVLLRERESLLHQDLDGILGCIKEKEILLTQGRFLDESRAILSNRFKGSMGSWGSEIRLGQLLELVDEPERLQMTEYRERLKELTEKVKSLTAGNEYLIRSALGHVSRSIGFLSQLRGTTSSTYDDEGYMRQDGPWISRVMQQA
jgi:flagellar biosynthesis/type III secretory pathway chaperone